jgi:transposase
MFLKKTTKKVKGKTYINHLLVESVATTKGPRHRVLCSLGTLEPAPKEEWLSLAHKIESAIAGQQSLNPEGSVQAIAERIHPEALSVLTDRVEIMEARQAGPVHVAHQMWKRLDIDSVLESAGLNKRAQVLAEVLVTNRLVSPCSKLGVVSWVKRTALGDILRRDLSELNEDALYRNLDKLHPQKEVIESELLKRERQMFSLEEKILLYDLTSTYFEGEGKENPQATRGYSRDHRPDCKQVVIGLVLDEDGFPKAHEVFEGRRSDTTTVDEILAQLEKRTGKIGGATVVMDRGMSSQQNITQVLAHHHHYLVAARQSERLAHWQDYLDEQGWKEIIRPVSPLNLGQKKSRVWIKRCQLDEQAHLLCRSEGRMQKDRAIRELHEKRLIADLQKLASRVEKGRLVNPNKIHESIGRIKERYPLVARYYQISFDSSENALVWQEDSDKKEMAKQFDGSYLIKTDRLDMTEQEIWKSYLLLTRVESAFRSLKSPLRLRPIFHRLENRVQTHIFICVLAYHLLVCIEKMFLDRNIHTSWKTIRQRLSTHHVATVLLPTANGHILKVRKSMIAEPEHKEIYKILKIPENVIRPLKRWIDRDEK